MEESSVNQIIDIAQTIGMWVIFVWLYISEKAAHEETRKSYRSDLREISGLRQNLVRVDGELVARDKLEN